VRRLALSQFQPNRLAFSSWKEKHVLTVLRVVLLNSSLLLSRRVVESPAKRKQSRKAPSGQLSSSALSFSLPSSIDHSLPEVSEKKSESEEVVFFTYL